MHDHIPERGRHPDYLSDWVEQHRSPAETGRIGPPRAAIYARRSVADPRFVSIARQVAVSESHCRQIGTSYDPERHLYIDRHRSGSTMSGRISLKALLTAARDRLFDTVVVQGIDRLTRSAADAAIIVAEFETLGIAIHVAGTGPVAGEEVIFKAFQHQKELEGLVVRMRKGIRDAAEAGRMIGWLPKYGYDRAPRGGDFTINIEQAEVLRRCFESIDQGMNRSDLAKALNADGIPAPRSERWHPKIFFNAAGYGLLQSPLLKGISKWDRKAEKPICHDVPHLAIVDAALFDRVIAKLEDARIKCRRPADGIRMLATVAKCTCGAALANSGSTTKSGDAGMACTRPSHLDSCPEKTVIRRTEAERQYLRFIHDEILAPSRLEAWQSIRAEAVERIRRATETEHADLVRRIEDVESQMDMIGDEAGHEGLLFAYMASFEKEYHDLWRERDKLESLVAMHVDAAEAERLRSVIAEMLPKVPYRVTDQAEQAAVARMHMLVPRMIVARRRDGYVVRWLLGVSEGARELTIVDTGSEQWIERRFPAPPRGPLRRPEHILHFHRMADEGRFAYSDEDWEAVRHLFRSNKLASCDSRLFAEALIFLAASGLPPAMLPERYEGLWFARSTLRLANAIWPEMLANLDAVGSRLVADIDRKRFAPRRAR